jgi:hypothetical protein
MPGVADGRHHRHVPANVGAAGRTGSPDTRSLAAIPILSSSIRAASKVA